MTARKVKGGFIEIQLPAGSVEGASPNEKAKFLEMLARAFGGTILPSITLAKVEKASNIVRYQVNGMCRVPDLILPSSGLLVELDEKEKLGSCQVNADALVCFPSGYAILLTSYNIAASQVWRI